MSHIVTFNNDFVQKNDLNTIFVVCGPENFIYFPKNSQHNFQIFLFSLMHDMVQL